jgi:hypothetical protein
MTWKRVLIPLLLAAALFAGCSSAPTSTKPRALAKTWNVFRSHYATKQIEAVAVSGQNSGDNQLARDAARLQIDIRKQNDVSSLLDIVKITERCNQLGALPKSHMHT